MQPKKAVRKRPRPIISPEDRQLAYGLLIAEATVWRRLSEASAKTEDKELYLHRAWVLEQIAEEQR